MAKTNYAFEKRQRDLAKQKKKEEKRLKKAAGKDVRSPDGTGTEPTPAGQEEGAAEGGNGDGSGSGSGD